MDYLKRENSQSQNVEQIKSFYIPRQLRRLIQIDRQILEQKADDFTIVQTEEEYKKECSQTHPQVKNVHFLIQDQNQFKWQKSQGPISSLKKYMIMNKECVESIDEGDIFQRNNEKVLIISGEPGMGKSLILENLALNSNAENFFVKIPLNTCTRSRGDLESLRMKIRNIVDLPEFAAKDEKLILMFDGLDEVNDYRDEVIEFIDALRYSNYKLKKLLVTTRIHLVEQLEDHFGTFAFRLNNFNDEDQLNFFVKYWHQLNNNLDEYTLINAAFKLSSQVNLRLTQHIHQLIGIPLQTKMLADIYFNKINDTNDDSIFRIVFNNMGDLYRQFVETLVRDHLKNKKKYRFKQK
jgi:hypothetical protein